MGSGKKKKKQDVVKIKTAKIKDKRKVRVVPNPDGSWNVIVE